MSEINIHYWTLLASLTIAISDDFSKYSWHVFSSSAIAPRASSFWRRAFISFSWSISLFWIDCACTYFLAMVRSWLSYCAKSESSTFWVISESEFSESNLSKLPGMISFGAPSFYKDFFFLFSDWRLVSRTLSRKSTPIVYRFQRFASNFFDFFETPMP